MELVLNAVPVRRGSGERYQSYVASLLFGDIVRLIDDDRLYVPNQPELPDFAQRKANPTRLKAIARYILETYQDGTTFFPPICINVQPPPTYGDGKLFLPYHCVTLRLTDGQHRCFGIYQLFKNLQTQDSEQIRILSQLEIGVLLYAGLSLEDERQAFRDQNLLVQRPSVSLSHHFDRRSPTVAIAKQLLERVPQFQNNVELVANGLGKHNPNLMTFSTLVQATRFMFSHLELKQEEDLEALTDWASSFWIAAANAMTDNLWGMQTLQVRYQQRKQSIAVSAIVFQALGWLARDLYLEGIPAQKLPMWLAKLEEIDWRRENKFWLEQGVTQIGATEEPIISNTKTTVNRFYRVLREMVGVTPVCGLI